MVEHFDAVCGRCKDGCYGDVICAYGKYYHQYCFSCAVCKQDLLKQGYFFNSGEFYCRRDYHRLMGTKCAGCSKYVEGEVVLAIDHQFHPKCFGCVMCGKLFPPAVQICYDGEDFFCESCNMSPVGKEINDAISAVIGDKPRSESPEVSATDEAISAAIDDKEESGRSELPAINDAISEVIADEAISAIVADESISAVVADEAISAVVADEVESENLEVPAINDALSTATDDTGENNFPEISTCAGCERELKTGQALLALDKQWHLWCFTCHKCGLLLTGEYMGRNGVPYCEQDYQAEFGITCAGCGGYITGKVLQAGEKHYHPSCSRCAKCGKMFGEGEDMFLQGSEIWHPQCSDDHNYEYHREFSHDTTKSDESEFESPSPTNEVDAEVIQEVSQAIQESAPDLKAPAPDFKQASLPSHTRPYFDSPKADRNDLGIPGYRRVKPPQPVQHQSSTTSNASVVEGEEDAPPPPPPPPSKTTSSQRWKKYISSPYHMTPFKKVVTEATKTGSRPSSYIDTTGNEDDNEWLTANGRSLSVSTLSLSSTGTTESERVSPNTLKKNYGQKGIGYNQLKLRKSQRDFNRSSFKLPTGVDPDRLREFLLDPDHNVYLDDREFHQIFKITRERFYALPSSKKEELKNHVLLFIAPRLKSDVL